MARAGRCETHLGLKQQLSAVPLFQIILAVKARSHGLMWSPEFCFSLSGRVSTAAQEATLPTTGQGDSELILKLCSCVVTGRKLFAVMCWFAMFFFFLIHLQVMFYVDFLLCIVKVRSICVWLFYLTQDILPA